MQNLDIDELFFGSIDMRLHIGPNEMPAYLDSVEAAEQATDVGMKTHGLLQYRR